MVFGDDTTTRQQQQQQQIQQQIEKRRPWCSNLSIYHVVGIVFIINIISQRRNWKQLLLDNNDNTTTTKQRTKNQSSGSSSSYNYNNWYDRFVQSTILQVVITDTNNTNDNNDESIAPVFDDNKSTIEALASKATSSKATNEGNWFDKFVHSTILEEVSNNITNSNDSDENNDIVPRGEEEGEDSGTNDVNNQGTGRHYTNPQKQQQSNHDLVENDTNNNNDGFAACLLIMDDNHNIIEWIAYHYYVLPLKYLIIAIDPRSTTDPTEIIQRYNNTLDNFTIEIWYNESQYIPNVTEDLYRAAEYQKLDIQKKAIRTKNKKDIERNNFLSIEVIQHRIRQGYFYSKCLQYHYELNHTWTTFVDSDEYILLNYPTIHTKLQQYNTTIQNVSNDNEPIHKQKQKQEQKLLDPLQDVPSIQEYGSVLKFINNPLYQQLFFPYLAQQQQQQQQQQNLLLHNTSDNKTNALIPNDTPCVQIPRRRFGSIPYNTSKYRDDNNNNNNNNNNKETILQPPSLSSSLSNTINGNLSTRTFFYHAADGDIKQNGLSKAIINVQYLQIDDVANTNNNKGNAHRPNMKYCTTRNLWISAPDQILLINHYLGSWEQFNYRNDSRRSYDRFMKTANLQEGFNTDIYPWLDGFINFVGNETAQYLLQDVGKVVDT